MRLEASEEACPSIDMAEKVWEDRGLEVEDREAVTVDIRMRRCPRWQIKGNKVHKSQSSRGPSMNVHEEGEAHSIPPATINTPQSNSFFEVGYLNSSPIPLNSSLHYYIQYKSVRSNTPLPFDGEP